MLLADFMLWGLTLNDVLTIVFIVTTVVSSVAAVVKHLKAGNYKGAADEARKLNTEFMVAIDGLKKVSPSTERKGVMKDLGKRLGGLREKVDRDLEDLGLDSKG